MKRLPAFLLLLAPVAVLAHEGHGHTHEYSIFHYLLEPIHLVSTLVVATGIYLLYKSMKRRTKKA